MKNTQMILFLSVIATVCLTNCKKEHTVTKKCQIITATAGQESYNITYDGEGRMSSMLLLPSKQLVSSIYSGNVITVTWTEAGGTFLYREIITLNEKGFAVNLRIENNSSGSEWSNQVNQYNGTQVLKSIHTSSGGASSVTDYIWENGNIKQVKRGPSTVSYEYYDEPYQAGDWRHLQEIIYSVKIYDNKNLTRSLKVDDEDTTYFTYDTDGEGNIKSITSTTGTDIYTFNYAYQCN